jgi:hypothetical protein
MENFQGMSGRMEAEGSVYIFQVPVGKTVRSTLQKLAGGKVLLRKHLDC